VYVAYQGQTSAPINVSVAQAAPALFTANSSGTGQAAAVDASGPYNNTANPASSGQWVYLYGTGFGQTNPPGEDGAFSLAPPAGVLPLPLLQPVTVTIGREHELRRRRARHRAGSNPDQRADSGWPAGR